ncbi:aldehyde dehydrogenase [Candidatus Pacearchaeota archaeon]|nr:aldehyde dehydrogenase [Candidatus Pacearchaeota archaeon]
MGLITTINPSTEEVYGVIEENSNEEINEIIRKAKNDKTWPLMSIDERVRIIEKLVGILEEHTETISKTMAGEIGKPLKAGRHEVEISNKRVREFCNLVPVFIQDEEIFENDIERNYIRYESIGTVVIISPWNAPVFVSLASIIPALLCGNNVIWKPSEYAIFSCLELNKLFDILKKEGLPDVAFQIVIGGKEIGKYLVESDIDFVSLTGSIIAGKEVFENCAQKLHKFVLELGGKDPAIILEDADLDKCAKEIVKSATMYTGQVCFGVERVYCAEKRYDEFVQKCVDEIKKIKVGDPFNEEMDMGQFSVKFQLEKVLLHINDALQKGAKILYGGTKIGNKGYFLSPAVIVNVNHSMLIMNEETFGPVIPIIKVNDVNEAIRLANDSIYGLTASVWTSDLMKGEEIAKRIEAGTVEINRHGMSKAGCPWGGYKMSGIGRIYSKEGVRNFCNIKHVWVVKR